MTPDLIATALKYGGAPGLALVILAFTWTRRGADGKASEIDALSAEVAALTKGYNDHNVRIAVLETQVAERHGKK